MALLSVRMVGAWWAHFECTRINIGPTILRTKIEDVREAGASIAGDGCAEPL